MATKKSSPSKAPKSKTPSTKLTNYQKRQLYQYWRKVGGLSKQEADKKKNNLFTALAHNRQARRFSPDFPLVPVQLTRGQLQAFEKKVIRQGGKIPEEYYGKKNNLEKQKTLAQILGYQEALKDKFGRAPKELLKEFRERLKNSTTEKEIWQAIQAAYSKGLKPKFELDEEGNRKVRF